MPKGGFAQGIMGQSVTRIQVRGISACGMKLSWVKFDQVRSSWIKFSVVGR
jgi:hypothetical protein